METKTGEHITHCSCPTSPESRDYNIIRGIYFAAAAKYKIGVPYMQSAQRKRIKYKII